MRCAVRFALATTLATTMTFALVPARGEDAAHPPKAEEAETLHCLDQKDRKAESDANHLVRLGAAMRVVRTRMPGTVVRARLCRDNDELVYVLTVLAHDGKVARLTVDAVKGTLVGGL
jgi:uncharacterized membrane protein YkoI